ncbi:hypothetical protein QQ045_024813 [Rhodiola kirilowii]
MVAKGKAKCAHINWVEVAPTPRALISPTKSKARNKGSNLETILEEGSDRTEVVQAKFALLVLPVLISSLSYLLLYRLDGLSF